MADGGDGTLDALVAALDGRRVPARVTGPLGDPVDAEYGLVEGRAEVTAVIEMARASGLTLVSPGRRDPLRATTRGTGELILAACRAGARTVLLCIGGSATNDAGAGMAQVIGIRLLDANGADVRPGGAGLAELARIDLGGLDPAVASAAFVVATDVDNPLVGPQGASAVYGPQKGASEADVTILDRALGHFAAIVHRDLGIDVRDVPGAGAAGGLGAGSMAFLGARIRPGVDVVMEALDLPQRIHAVDVAVTGEGRFDQQSLRGKVPAGLMRIAAVAGVPVIVLCGEAATELPGEGVEVLSLSDRYGGEAATERAGPLLEELAVEVAARTDQRWGQRDRRAEGDRRGRGA
jgi:glycerate kinase